MNSELSRKSSSQHSDEMLRHAGRGKHPRPEYRTLFARWQREGDRHARDVLFARFSPLARKLARRYVHTSEPYEDLVQVANVALLKAIDRFDAGRDVGFPAFAVPTILGELRRYFRDMTWRVHVPRGAQERALAVQAAQERLAGRLGREPTVDELATCLELSRTHVADAMEAIQAYTTLSLDTPTRIDGEDDEGATIVDIVGGPDERFDLIDANVALVKALRGLPLRERRILHLRYVHDMTQSEIADELGVSQMQISRLLARALARLRILTGAEEPPDAAASRGAGKHAAKARRGRAARARPGSRRSRRPNPASTLRGAYPLSGVVTYT